MSQLSALIAKLEAKSQSLETTISQSLGNHNALLGYANAVKEILGIASEFLPASTVLAGVETAVNVVDNLLVSSGNLSQTTPQVASAE